MSSFRPLTRRDALKTAALGALALPLLNGRLLAADSGAPTAAATKERLRLGVAGYTFRDFGLAETLTALKALRVTNACVFKNQLNWETATPDEAKAVADKYHAAGI